MCQHPPPLVQPLVMMTFVLQNGWSPLNGASEKGHLDVVRTLLEAGANINQADKVGTYMMFIELQLYLYNTADCTVYINALSVHVYCVGAVWCVMLYPCLCIIIA